jgi:hypothetical protein
MPLPYLNAYFFQSIVNFFRKYNPSIFRRTNYMVYEYRDIVAFVEVYTHEATLPQQWNPQQAAGN